MMSENDKLRIILFVYQENLIYYSGKTNNKQVMFRNKLAKGLGDNRCTHAISLIFS